MARVVVMGVSGCGKSSVAAALGERLGMAYIDADDLHPPANIAKMSAGQPLTDADRWPWLDEVGRRLAAGSGPAIVACSALRRRYRDRIRAAVPGPVHFLHLAADISVIGARMQARSGHFMPPALLQSQFDTLEPLEPGEAGTVIDIAPPLSEVIEASVTAVGALRD